MKQTLEILRKDLRHLWPDIALSLVPLAALAWLDAQRYDFAPGPSESLLHIVVLIVWAIVIARAIHQESPASNRQFWLTRPYSRASLVAAKAAYLILAIHVPAAIAHVCILAAHGFRPWQWIPQLAAKQLLIAAGWTLPVAAVAASSTGLASFAVAILTIVAGATVLNFGPAAQQLPWIEPPLVKIALCLALICAAAAFAVTAQYFRRATWTARIVLGTGAALGIGVLALLPYRTEVRLRCLSRPSSHESLAIRYDPGRGPVPDVMSTDDSPVALVPVDIASRNPRGEAKIAFAPLGLSIQGAGGYRWQDAHDTERLNGMVWQRSSGEAALQLRLDRPAFERLRQAPVNIQVTLAATIYKRGGTSAAQGPLPWTFDAVGAGRCYVSMVADAPQRRRLLKVVCESPAEIPSAIEVVLRHPASGRVWTQILGDAMNDMRYPRLTWLSPLDRRATFFHVVRTVDDRPGNRWLVPEALVPELRIEITGVSQVTCETVSSTLSGVDLNRWLVTDKTPAAAVR